MKATVLFFSWLSWELSKVSLGLSTGIFVGVGMTMFLLPPVPGMPIYLTGGILLVAKGKERFGIFGAIVVMPLEVSDDPPHPTPFDKCAKAMQAPDVPACILPRRPRCFETDRKDIALAAPTVGRPGRRLGRSACLLACLLAGACKTAISGDPPPA